MTEPTPGVTKVSVLLADKGKVNPSVGTIDLLNVGFATASLNVMPQMVPFIGSQAIAVFFEVPWDRCNRDLSLKLELVDDDEKVVELATPVGHTAVTITQSIRVGPPAGAPHGTPGTGNLLVELGAPGLTLAPGRRYRWRVTLDGKTDPQWEAGFWVPPITSPDVFGPT